MTQPAHDDAQRDVHGVVTRTSAVRKAREISTGDAEAGWSIAGLFELNLLGSLHVTITALTGDFMFGGSHLVADGYTNNVPEPSTIALLCIGLLGIAAGARRRKANRA